MGLSLVEIADVIAMHDTGTVPCRHVRALAESKVSQIDTRATELQRLKAGLVRLTQAARKVEPSCSRHPSVCLAFEKATQVPS